MCAEAAAQRCHRSLIADALIVLGTRVEHVMNGKTSRVHILTSFGRVRRKTHHSPSQQGRPCPRTTTSSLSPDTTTCARLQNMVSYGSEAS
jgi:hypothetical protein